MQPVTVQAELVERLLDPADPALRARVLTDLLDRRADDPDVLAARERIPEQPWVRSTLSARRGDGTWGRSFYDKYRGTSWVLLHLSEVGAPAELPPIRAGVERLLDTAIPISRLTGFRAALFRDNTDGVYWEHPIPCLTTHMALVLVRAGLPDHPVTRAALETCRHLAVAGAGIGCYVMADSLLPACVMAAPKVLKAFLALPPERRTAEDRALIQTLVDVLLGFELYRYVPRDTQEWREAARTLTPAVRRRAKAQWIADGRLEPRRPKAGWLKFSFPHSYNSDLLEVLLLLGEAGAPLDGTIEEGLELVRSARTGDGTWKLIGGLDGKMHGHLDRPGRGSPWITYRALLAFKRFGLLEMAA